MQHITLLCVGRVNAAYYAGGIEDYAKRLSAFCRFQVVEIPEETVHEKNSSPALVSAALEREGEKLLAALPKGARLVSLCVEGKQMTSEAFAGWLENAALSGQGHVAFAIGSSHGLSDAVKQRSGLLLSLSRMTLPHQLARLVLTEQIYRAFMIRSGSRYHK